MLDAFIVETQHRSRYATYRWAAINGRSRIRRRLRTIQYHKWKPSFKMWLISGIVLSVLVIFLLVARLACCLANKRGRGPVIRPPMILRQGLVDNKNCGLVYKPLQEEIATPHMPKRGSFYSSSTFHYDKIVPESV